MKVILSIILIFSFSGLFAQEYQYVPFSENGEWTVDFYSSVDCGIPPGFCGQHSYGFTGDTVIASIAYNILNSGVFFREDTTAQQIIVYGGGGSNMCNGQQECVAYDFSLNVGDSLLVPHIMSGGVSDWYQRVVNIDTVDFNGSLRKVFSLSDGNRWIEGIGGANGPFQNYDQFERWTILRCFSDEDELIYSDPPPSWYEFEYPNYPYCDSSVMSIPPNRKSRVLWYPNPVNDLVYFDNLEQEAIANVSIFDVTGKQIFQIALKPADNRISLKSLKSGIYHLIVETQSGEEFNFKIIKE